MGESIHTINLSENLTLESGSLIRNNISGTSTGNGGEIQVTAQNLAIEDTSRIITFSQGVGNTGNITVNVEFFNLFQRLR